ncbi:hypothetical protein JCM10213_005144 [Rhodosporidiobolus nylandii]
MLLPRPTLPLLALPFLALPSVAQLLPISLAQRNCLGTGELVAPQDQQLVFTAAYAQFVQGQRSIGDKADGVSFDALPQPVYNQEGAILTGQGDLLRLVVVGNTVAQSEGYSNDTSYLSTLVVDSQVLTFEVASNSSWLCSSIRTNEGTTGTTSNGSEVVTDSGCPYSGEIALGVQIPLASSYPLTTITTSLVALDPSVPALHLACYDLDFTPYYPDYFPYLLVRYLIIGILALFLLLYVLARFYASYTTWLADNEAEIASSLTLKLSSPHAISSRRQTWGSICFGAWAGKQVVASGSLRRYVTAELRELFQMVAWFSLVGTVAVQWPGFAYPVFSQFAWTSLIYNNSLSFTSPAAPVLPANATVPSDFASQIGDVTSPLYLDTSLPNVLLDLDSSADGIERWARMIGVRHEDLWSICAFTFFCLCAGIIAAHVVFFACDSALDAVLPDSRRASVPKQVNLEDKPELDGAADESAFSLSKESGGTQRGHGRMGVRRQSDGSMGRYLDSADFLDDEYLDESADYGRPVRPEDRHPSWQLYLSLLQGNLTRALMLFHLPLCLFSTYQFTLYSSAPTSTFALAVVTFAVVCVGVPVALLWRIHAKSIRELYTNLPTLLSLGVLYNTYSDECTLFPLSTFGGNLVVGIVIGAAQNTGTAQAAVILLVEVGQTLATSLWLPWADNAAMGPLAFLLSLARIIIAVLLVVLSPTVNVSASAASWIAYIVFLVEGLVLLLLVWVVAFKLLELVVRLVGGVPFDESRSSRGGGLLGAFRKARGRGSGKKRRGGNAGAARANAAKRRAIEERRRRNLHRDRYGTGMSDRSSVAARTHMLPSAVRPAGHSSLSLNGAGAPFPSSGLDEDGYIMSAMSSRGWDTASEASSQRPGYVKPGAYASANAGGPILRSVQQHWGHSEVSMTSPSPNSAIIVPAAAVPAPSTVSGGSGFTRVGGGKASHSNPYQLVNAGQPAAAYPPYPASSADMYSTPAFVSPTQRRQSSTAVVELAGASAPGFTGGAPTRPSLSLPSSSALLSNSVSPAGGRGRLDDEHNRRPSARVRNRHLANQGGFFGRFKKQRASFSDEEDLTDETDTDDENARPKRSGAWGALAGLGGAFGKRKERRGGEEEYDPPEEPEPAPEEKGFSVVRKPRPRPSPPASAALASEPKAQDFGAPDTPSAQAHPSDPLLGSSGLPPGAAPPRGASPPPHVSVEAPSRPASMKGEEAAEVGASWEDQQGR